MIYPGQPPNGTQGGHWAFTYIHVCTTMTVILPPLLAVLATLVAVRPTVAHGGLANYTVGDTWYRGYVFLCSALFKISSRTLRVVDYVAVHYEVVYTTRYSVLDEVVLYTTKWPVYYEVVVCALQRGLLYNVVYLLQRTTVYTLQSDTLSKQSTNFFYENRFDPSEPFSEQVSQPWTVQRQWNTIDPIFSITDPFLACNNPGTPPVSYIPIRAGENLTAVYWFWLHPVGPMSVWLTPCGNLACEEVDVNEAKWFKVWEAGLLEGPNLAEGVWYQKQFQKWDGSPALWPVTIPANLKRARYIVRHEILSIHVEMRPQFYPQCAHLLVLGEEDTKEGKGMPPEKSEYWKKFPGVYEQGDESIFIDIYKEEYKNRTVSFFFLLPFTKRLERQKKKKLTDTMCTALCCARRADLGWVSLLCC